MHAAVNPTSESEAQRKPKQVIVKPVLISKCLPVLSQLISKSQWNSRT